MPRIANMIVLAAADNVGVALRDIAEGEAALDARGRELAARERIPQGHKIALGRIREGEAIVRLGVPVGIAKSEIALGRLVHIHNVKSRYLDNDQDHFE
jgi:DNA-directed RNA polymerase subunit K/omega